MGGNNVSTPSVKHLEHDVFDIFGFIAIDGSHNVVGQMPNTPPIATQVYSRCKGLLKSVGIAGAVVTQPYQSTGFYQFTLDEPWFALLDWDVSPLDQGAVALPSPSIKANVRANTNGYLAGIMPGTDTSIAAQTVQLRFRLPTTGALTDLAVSTGFWIRLRLLRTGTP